ncbi:hypothetical protein [Cutibacterium sp.]|uniref:hypothetical protein n=1 Tax=Cutibacterium sp. TaxID=1912221 RepID=UPI0026DA9FB1|nr:hypothetical protein [Cutibacterium sp.]MDO4412750.1 hypothetical protein [Cutibacterium sp.]
MSARRSRHVSVSGGNSLVKGLGFPLEVTLATLRGTDPTAAPNHHNREQASTPGNKPAHEQTGPTTQ